MPKSQIFNVANKSFSGIHKKKILVKVSEFSVVFVLFDK